MIKTKYQHTVVNRFAQLDQDLPQWINWTGIAVLVLAWELICRMGWVTPLFLPSPSAILITIVQMLSGGEILGNIYASLYRIGLGFTVGSVIGIIAGLLLGFSKLAEAVGNTILYSIYPIPKIALLPLIILWLGIGELSKVSIIALGVFFPVVINTYSGVKHVDPNLIKVAVSFNATRFNIIRKVILPGALPVIFAGLKLAAGTSLLLLVAAEMIAAKEGIGAMILHYGDLMLTTKLMVGVLTLSLLGVIFTQLLNIIEKRIITWKK